MCGVSESLNLRSPPFLCSTRRETHVAGWCTQRHLTPGAQLKPGHVVGKRKCEVGLTGILTLVFCLETCGPTASAPSACLVLLLSVPRRRRPLSVEVGRRCLVFPSLALEAAGASQSSVQRGGGAGSDCLSGYGGLASV